MSTSPRPVVCVSTCHAVIGGRPGVSSSGSQVESGAVSEKRPSSTRRMTAVATIGLVIEASRQTAAAPTGAASFGGTASRRIVPAALATPRMTNGTTPSSTWRAARAKARSRATVIEAVGRHGATIRRG